MKKLQLNNKAQAFEIAPETTTVTEQEENNFEPNPSLKLKPKQKSMNEDLEVEEITEP